jgi:hypothetical protein
LQDGNEQVDQWCEIIADEAERMGDSELDPYVQKAFDLLNNKENESGLEKSVAAAKGYHSVKVNANGTVTGTYTPIGSRVERTITCDSQGKCK